MAGLGFSFVSKGKMKEIELGGGSDGHRLRRRHVEYFDQPMEDLQQESESPEPDDSSSDAASDELRKELELRADNYFHRTELARALNFVSALRRQDYGRPLRTAMQRTRGDGDRVKPWSGYKDEVSDSELSDHQEPSMSSKHARTTGLDHSFETPDALQAANAKIKRLEQELERREREKEALKGRVAKLEEEGYRTRTPLRLPFRCAPGAGSSK